MTEDELAEVAAQFVARVREDDPEANARWLDAACPDQGDRYALLFVLAAAVPVDKSWAELTRWARALTMVKVGDAEPTMPADLDEVALRRALRGEAVAVPTAHKRYMVAVLTRHGLSARVIGERLGLTERQVQRHRDAWRTTQNSVVDMAGIGDPEPSVQTRTVSG